MGSGAVAFWVEEPEEDLEPERNVEFEDVAFLATGETDEDWLYGSD